MSVYTLKNISVLNCNFELFLQFVVRVVRRKVDSVETEQKHRLSISTAPFTPRNKLNRFVNPV